jgi:hypothetical protein
MLSSRNVTWLNLAYGDWAGIQQPALNSSTGTGTPSTLSNEDTGNDLPSTPTENPSPNNPPTKHLYSLPDSPTNFPPNPSESIILPVPAPTSSRLTRELRRLADHNSHSVQSPVPTPPLRSTRSGGIRTLHQQGPRPTNTDKDALPSPVAPLVETVHDEEEQRTNDPAPNGLDYF